MIIYFSSTGNNKYLAKLLKRQNEKIISITDLYDSNCLYLQDDVIGIISPTYFLGLPELVKEYLSKVTLKAKYIYFVASYGTTPGFSGEQVNKILNNKLNASFSVQMVDTYTPNFDLSTKKKQDKYLKHFDEHLKEVKDHIENKDNGNFQKRKVPYKTANKICKSFYDKARLTKYLNVNDNCIGCGLCAKKCPIGAIEIKDKKPVWVKDKCLLCLSCYHHCPKNAINYKKSTLKHGQYVNPNGK